MEGRKDARVCGWMDMGLEGHAGGWMDLGGRDIGTHG
jgi:hypothetical protein